ncbi:MAG: bi-domain-containing oxidoreductase [Planctomycetaceae bacterium]
MPDRTLWQRLRPENWDPRLTLHAKAALKGRRILEGMRVMFPEPRAARLERCFFLSPDAGELFVENRCTVVSPGTERAIYLEAPNAAARFPFQPGYAAAGVVRAVGPGVRGFRVGDRVATSMGHCSRGVIPAAKCTRIPSRVPDEEACFRQLAMIAFSGVVQCDPRVGESIAVVGRGMIGLLTLRLLSAAGGFRLTSVARSRTARDAASRSGADELLDSGLNQTPPSGGEFDAVIDATGDPSAIRQAMAWVGPGGRLVVLGSPRGVTGGFDAGFMADRGVELRGAHISGFSGAAARRHGWTASTAAEYVVALMEAGRLRVSDLIDRRLRPDELPGFYRELSDGTKSTRCLGVLVDWAAGSGVPPAAPSGAAVPFRERVRPIERFSNWAKETARPREAMPADLAEPVGTVRFALVGCGTAAAKTAQALRLAPSAELRCAVDLNRSLLDGFRQRFGVAGTTDLDEVLRSPDIDAVFLGTPHPSHLPLAERCAAAGKHLIVEKPLATTEEEIGTLIDVCARSGVRVTVNYSRRFQPQMQFARKLIAAGGLGRLVGATVLFAQEKRRDYWIDSRSGDPNWRAAQSSSGGGMLLTTMVHHLDYLFWMAGQPGAYAGGSLGTLGSPEGVSVEDSLAVTFRFPNGGIGTIAGSTCCPGGQDYLSLWGTDGQLRVEGDEFTVHTKRPVPDLVPGMWQRVPTALKVSERGILVEHFARAILQGGDVPVDPVDSLAVARLIDAAYSDTGIEAAGGAWP